MLYTTKPPGMQASIIQCLPQAKISWEGCGRKDIQHKNGGMMEVGAPIGLSVRLPLLCFPAPQNPEDGEQ